MSKIHVKGINATIQELLNSNKSISRFGDGEFRWLLDDNHDSFQKSSDKLSQCLKKVLNSNRQDLMIAIPGAFTSINQFVPRAQHFWELFFTEYGKDILPYLNKDKQYYDTNMSRLYIDYKDKSKSKHYFNCLKKLWQNKNILIIEGKDSRLGVGNDLFENTKCIRRIECPPTNAFNYYNLILQYSRSFLSKNTNFLTLIALGPTATILAYDLSLMGYRAIDIGNFDVEYEWLLMNAKDKVNIPSRYINEVHGGTNVTNVCDKKYYNEIIHDI